ncbi:MAG: hypothetical protein ACJ72K_09485 [Friedmanniella sp.]|jgi:hypothetical protein
MKIKTVLVAGLAGGIGYILGTRAGQDRYEQIKAQADRLAHSPQVQETVTNLAEGVKKNAGKLPDPVADVVTKVADTVSSSTDAQPGSGVGAGLADADLGGSEVGSPDVGTIDLGTTDVGSDLGTDLGETDTEPRRAE